MFFILSKVFWFVVAPANLLLLLVCLAAVLSWTRWRRTRRWVIGLAACLGLAFATLPVGQQMLLTLENRFPVVTDLPARVDGIITLGGVVNQFVTRARGQVALGGSVERITEFAALAHRFPDAKLVFTGGSGNLFRQDVKEADVLRPFLDFLGLDMDRVVLENESRNTHENAVLTRKLLDPAPGETWIVITSAFHMPRTVGSFREAGWTIIPYPVDFKFAGDEGFDLSFNLGSGMAWLNGGLHEWLGLVFYWLTGKSDAIFPGPEARARRMTIAAPPALWQKGEGEIWKHS
jgi:uncharacterized SAM-binding protein YcdF (DUF218 family)